MINSFRAAYIAWDRTRSLATSQLKTERSFDYGEFPLQQFYNLILETNQNFQIGTLDHETIIGLEINKNPFLISGEGIKTSTTIPPTSIASVISNFYSTQDFISKKNYLGVFIEHGITLSDRLSINFEGTLDTVIGDTTDLPELPAVEPIENNNFYPEISLEYELIDNTLIFTTINYASEPITGTDAKNQLLQSEIYQGLELGIETEFGNNWLATLSFYHETQNNITTTDPNEPDFDLQINEQINQSWTGELRGEITPGCWVYGFYTYTDATVTEDEAIQVGSSASGVAHHSGGLWVSYEITQGAWQNFGFGGGVVANSERSGDAKNSFYFPGYLQTDLAIFYAQDNFKAAISVQNLFNAGVEDDEVTPQTIFGTALWEF
jgi:outer membrane receptor protein involved in Fe transport